MVIYQLPNGKIIRLTLEEYLDLSDEDIVYLVSIDFGESAQSPWTGSVLPYNTKGKDFENFEEDGDSNIRGDLPEDFDMGLDIPDVDFE